MTIGGDGVKRIKKWAKPAGFILMLVAIAFIIRTLFSLSIDFTRIVSINNLVLIGFLSVFIYTANLFAAAYGWQMILAFIAGKGAGYKDVSNAYVKANIAKYLPGNVMHYAGRNLLGAKYGFEQLDIAFSSLAEIGMQILSAFLLSVLFSGRQLINILHGQFESVQSVVAAPVALLIIALVILCVVLIRKKKDKLQKYKLFFTKRFWYFTIRILPLYVIVLLLTGLVLVMTFQFVLGVDAIAYMGTVIMAYIIAWLAGFMVPGAPGGIGVREAVLFFLLTPIFGKEMTILAAVIQRLFSIIGDVLAFTVKISAEALQKRKHGGQNRESP